MHVHFNGIANNFINHGVSCDKCLFTKERASGQHLPVPIMKVFCGDVKMFRLAMMIRGKSRRQYTSLLLHEP